VPEAEQTLARLAGIPDLAISSNTPLARYTRFGIGGPADIYAETGNEEAFIRALNVAQSSGLEFVVIAGGTNLIVSDEGFRGLVLRFVANRLSAHDGSVHAEAGAVLQELVDFTVARGLKGLETLTGIPGSVGAAIYGNAGAYGHSISECIREVRFFDGRRVRRFTQAECEFHYRESIFKQRKDWIIFAAELRLESAPASELQRTADEILRVRNQKFPVTMKCAGSIFKNLLLAELSEAVASEVPASVIREGKVPAAHFLEQVGAKGMRVGDICVADYHANLIYNSGEGTARDLRFLIDELKRRVRDRFGLELEEEVQYVGFPAVCSPENSMGRRKPDAPVPA